MRGDELTDDNSDDRERDGNLHAAENEGGDVGKRTRMRSCHSDIRKDRQSRSIVVDRLQASRRGHRIGKNEMNIENVTRDDEPIPSQTMKSGASAISG